MQVSGKTVLFFQLWKVWYPSFLAPCFLMRNPLSFVVFFPPGKVLFYSVCFQDFFNFQKLNYDVFWHGFLWVYPMSSWILNLWVSVFWHIWEVFSHYLPNPFSAALFILSFWDSSTWMWDLLLQCHMSTRLSSFFFQSILLLFRLVNSCCSVLKLTDSLLLILPPIPPPEF